MSESRSKLEEILELLLSEENEAAEEALHEYVVAKARAEYEKVLDEDVADEDEVEESAQDGVSELELEVDELECEPDEVLSKSSSSNKYFSSNNSISLLYDCSFVENCLIY